jgi:hypothetical protein
MYVWQITTYFFAFVSLFFTRLWLFTELLIQVTGPVTLIENALFTLSEHMCPSPAISGIRLAQSLLCFRTLFVLYLWSLYCISCSFCVLGLLFVWYLWPLYCMSCSLLCFRTFVCLISLAIVLYVLLFVVFYDFFCLISLVIVLYVLLLVVF